MREGVLGYLLTPSEPVASERLSVRTTLPSMSHVRVSCCQSICAGVNRCIHELMYAKTYGVVVVVDEGVSEVAVDTTGSLCSYEEI